MESAPTLPAGGRERSPLLEMLLIAGPVVATMTSYTLMQFIDGLMVSRIGPDPVYVAAQGNGGVAAWIPTATLMGLLSVVNTYVSQNLGAKHAERGAAYAWAGLWICLFAWLAVMLPYAALLPTVMATMTDHSPELLKLEGDYSRVLLIGSFFTIAARCIAQYFYGMHKPMTVFGAVLAGNATNLVLNCFLIYGPTPPVIAGGLGEILNPWFEFTGSACRSLGIPAMGVAGAALATVIGTVVEFAIPMARFLGRRFNALYGTRAAWRPSRAHMRDLFKLGWPGALMLGNEIICWAYLMAALIGHFGEVHNTAGWIALRYMHLAFMPAVGLSIAVTAQVGKCMGMKRPDLAVRRTWLGVGLTMVYMGLCALGFVLFRNEAIALFVDPSTTPEQRAELVRIGSEVMIAAAIFQLFDALGITIIGALRGAGDTVWPGVITLVLAWSCIVLGGHAMIRLFPELGSLGPWIAASAYIVLLGSSMCVRFVLGGWKRIDLLKSQASMVMPRVPPSGEMDVPAPPSDPEAGCS
jgi:MATE family multidrug resistance protein